VNKFLFPLSLSFITSCAVFILCISIRSGLASTDQEQNEEINELDALPMFILDKSFQVRDKLNLELDGSEEAKGIEKKSESWNRLIFQNTQNWRAFREYPFKHMSQEILRLDGSDYILSSREGRVLSKQAFSPSAWMEIVLSAYRIAKKLNLAPSGMSFTDFWEELHDMKAPTTTPNGSSLSVEKKPDLIRVVIEGSYLHDGRTKVKIKQEWSIDFGVKVSEKELQQALVGSSS